MTQHYDAGDDAFAAMQEAQVGQGEGATEGSGDVAPAFDAGAFEASTLAAVAEANEATVPTSKVQAEIARIEEELRGGTTHESAGEMNANDPEADPWANPELAEMVTAYNDSVSQGERLKDSIARGDDENARLFMHQNHESPEALLAKINTERQRLGFPPRQ